ncbi:hypothetical protein Hanom_Chr12g01106041 [Helianthus anomalus]
MGKNGSQREIVGFRMNERIMMVIASEICIYRKRQRFSLCQLASC